MAEHRQRTTQLSGQLRDEVITFLRRWLPEEAKRAYRQMIDEDPMNWARHPHFAGGVIVNGALRGNGIDERTLGVSNLDHLWPELLYDAVKTASEPCANDPVVLPEQCAEPTEINSQ